MFELLPQTEGRNLAIRASGKVNAGAYRSFQPEFDRWVEKSLQFRLLLDWEDFEGWDEDVIPVKLGERIMHRMRCERLAILSDDPQRWDDIEKLRGVLMSREIRIYPPVEREAAWNWLSQ